MPIADEIRIEQKFDPTGENGGYTCSTESSGNVLSVLVVEDLPSHFLPDVNDMVQVVLAVPCPEIPRTVFWRSIDSNTFRYRMDADTVQFESVLHTGVPLKIADLSIKGKVIDSSFWNVEERLL